MKDKLILKKNENNLILYCICNILPNYCKIIYRFIVYYSI